MPRFAAASLIAVIFINMLGFGIIVPLLPFYADSFDAEPWQIGAIFGAYSVGAFFGEPLWGRLSDKYGRKPLLISTIIGNCLCYLALAFAPNIWVAFAIRLVGGLAAGNGAVVQGYIADVTPPEKRARQMSYQGAAWNVGLIIGPAVGGFFAHTGMGPAGFRIPLFIASGLAALCVVAIMFFIKESRVREEGISHRPSRWSAIGEAVSHPVIGRMMLLTFLVGFAFTGIESQFGLWSQARFGWGPREIAVCFAFTGATAFFFQTMITGPMSERFGEGVMLSVGMGMTAVAAALQVFSVSGPMTIALMCLTAAGQSVAFPNVGAIISRTADPHRQGQIMGLNNATGALARVVGPVCAGLMVPVMRDGPFILGALVVAPAILLALSATRRSRLLTEPPKPEP
ncbi:MAG: MFS transporter [Phenylobacterium sp.]|uniref:MFS transporter n=1 Tax=Phenylobacterium sp. TaxID=1871053 RepID=UPI002729187B|nr:MFS transporter [Phenylobacterium sp.]MDO8913444.1 MFS transporter [Phenylobacterium sp.]MDP3101815.1 MFS transporter [Phenylobacterium sp.]